MVVPYHLVHAVEVTVELYYDVFAGVAARDAYRGHGGFGTGVKKSELFDSGNELGKILCEFYRLFRIVIHQEALFDAFFKSCLNARMLVAEH